MKKHVIGLLVAAGAALFSGGAMAGGSIKDSPAPAMHHDRCSGGKFAGAFIGADLGYGWGRADHANDAAAPFTLNQDGGVVAGVNAAYNWQCDRWVFGLVTDYSFGNIETTADYGGGDVVRNTVDGFGTTRVRVGVAHDHTLFYATAGVAYGKVDYDVIGCCTASNSDRKFGWTIGGGVEFMRDHWSLKAELLYVDLGKTNIVYALGCCYGATDWEDKFLVGRIGLSFKLHREEQIAHRPMK
jgi:outer membrane immunogenic protein